MHIVHLSLANFRNYVRLELDIPSGMVVLQGGNAQGKSNLLEALYFLATTRSHRAATDRELINWFAAREGPPFARILADVQQSKRSLRVEIAMRGNAGGESPVGKLAEAGQFASLYVEKRIRVNDIVRRAIDLIGQVNVVMFSSQAIELVGGAPGLRRHYLDVTNSQIDPRYLRTLQRYNRVLLQRNNLLRLIRDQRANPDQLAFWNEELVETGSYLIAERQTTISALNDLVEDVHQQLTGGQERLRMVYLGSVSEATGQDPDRVSEVFFDALKVAQGKEFAQGVSLVGPHRDDLRFLVNGMDMGIYGSRGQQRTIALSLKLAEARFLLSKTLDPPILLLDDVLSELDQERRHHLLRFVTPYEQVLITTTDFDPFEPGFLAQAAKFTIREGKIEALRDDIPGR